MSFYDREFYIVPGQQLVKYFPVFHVQYGLQLFSRFSLPAIAFPAGHPRLTHLSDVCTIRDDLHFRTATQLPEALDHRL